MNYTAFSERDLHDANFSKGNESVMLIYRRGEDQCNLMLTLSEIKELHAIAMAESVIDLTMDNIVGVGVDHISNTVEIHLQNEGLRFDLVFPIDVMDRGFTEANKELVKNFINGND